jgi:transcriptional regulator with XRE-family HTH domain
VDTHDAGALRELRVSRNVSQAKVARHAGVSVSHISRVENGDRPLTPAVINGYDQALDFPISTEVLPAARSGDTLRTYRRGQGTDDMKRRAFTAAVAAIAAGGPLGEPISRAVAALDHAEVPSRVGAADVVQVEQAADMFTAWDLRFGGGLAREIAKIQLRWATGLLNAKMGESVRDRLNCAVGALAERAAWSTFDSGQHDAARTLFKLALYEASEADDPDLRAHILSDIATQQMYLGHPDECLKLIRMAEGDDRISSAVRFVLHGVKARAFGTLADESSCLRQIGMAEQAYASVTGDNTPEWMTKFLNDAHVYSVTGQAAFALAQSTGTFRDDAHQRLTRAINGFDSGRARAVVLCATRLAILHLDAGHTGEGAAAARDALRAMPGLRSARIAEDLSTMRTATRRHASMNHLGADITLAISAVG